MEIKLFGKSLFEYKNAKKVAILDGVEECKKKGSKFLYDFMKVNDSSIPINDFLVFTPVDAAKPQKKKVAPAKSHLTPKDVYNFKMLNDEMFVLNTNTEYVDKQLDDFKEKLALISSEEYDMRRGVEEIASVVMRLENRKKYGDVKDFFEQYPYTMTSRINSLIAHHDYLKLGQVAQFLADMPKDATDAMKVYNEHTKKVCEKQAVFYIIADKKDFERKDKRRDPILLAQSPFGHFWQILGAWDASEMFLLSEL